MLTDAQYLAAARIILGVAPTNTTFTDAEVLAELREMCDPDDLRAALNIAFEAGRASLPTTEPSVLTWGYNEALQPAEIRDAVRTGCGGHVTEVHTGSDDYVVVLSTGPLTAEQARQVWEAQP